MERPSPLLGQAINPKKHQIIIGAGISGLLLGFFLKEAGVSFDIIEKSGRVGGLIDTIDRPYGKVETGANGILWCEEIDYVARRLDLKIVQPNQKEKKRFFVRNKQLRQFPLTIWETLGFVWRILVPNNKPIYTVADFGNAYLGRAGTEQILSPALSGIYGTPAHQLSFHAATKMLAEIKSQSNWLPLAIWKHRRAQKKSKNEGLPKGLHSFEGGMKTLVTSLANHLKDHIKLNEDIGEITDSAEEYIITTPAHQVSKIYRNLKLSELIDSIEYQSLISCSVFLKKLQLDRFKAGFGCLIPRNEDLKILGVLFSSVIYPARFQDEDVLCLRCILHDDLETKQMDDSDLVQYITGELDQLFGVNGMPIDAMTHRWEKGLPIYNENLYQLWAKIDHELKANHSNLRLFGNYTGEISVRGASQTGYQIMNDLRSNS